MSDVERDVTLGGHQVWEQNVSKLQWNLIEIHELPLGNQKERNKNASLCSFTHVSRAYNGLVYAEDAMSSKSENGMLMLLVSGLLFDLIDWIESISNARRLNRAWREKEIVSVLGGVHLLVNICSVKVFNNSRHHYLISCLITWAMLPMIKRSKLVILLCNENHMKAFFLKRMKSPGKNSCAISCEKRLRINHHLRSKTVRCRSRILRGAPFKNES